MPDARRLLIAAARGQLAGAAGTLAMDLLWYRRSRRAGGEPGFLAWETAAGLEGWDDAPAPAQVGRKLVQLVLRRDLDLEVHSPRLSTPSRSAPRTRAHAKAA